MTKEELVQDIKLKKTLGISTINEENILLLFEAVGFDEDIVETFLRGPVVKIKKKQ